MSHLTINRLRLAAHRVECRCLRQPRWIHRDHLRKAHGAITDAILADAGV
jgi:hypothetical protein